MKGDSALEEVLKVLACRFRKLFVRMEALADGREISGISKSVNLDEVSSFFFDGNRALIRSVQARLEVAIIRIGCSRSWNALEGSSVCVPTPSNGVLLLSLQNLSALSLEDGGLSDCKTAGAFCAKRRDFGCQFASRIPQWSAVYKGRQTGKEQSTGPRKATFSRRLNPSVSFTS